MLRLLQLTDPHLFGDPAGELYGQRTADTFRATLDAALREQRPDALLLTGDLVEDQSRAGYEFLRQVLDDTGLPAWCLPGNHDDPAIMAELMDSGRVRYLGWAAWANWTGVFLNTHVPGAPGGLLSDAELQRLDEVLRGTPDKPTLVCLHHQPLPVGSPWLDRYGLANAEEFRALLAQHPQVRVVCWGHVHQAFDEQRDGIRWLSTPSTGAQFTPQMDRCVMDTRPPGCRWLTLADDGQINTRIQWFDELAPSSRPVDSRQAAV
jgi:Icc protein